MDFRKIFIVITLSCTALPSLFGMRNNDDMRALFMQADVIRYQKTNKAIKALSYEKRLEALGEKLVSLIDELGGARIQKLDIESAKRITLELYNSLRILWDQVPALSVEEIDKNWLLQQAYLVSHKLLLESLDDNQQVTTCIGDIKTAFDKVRQPDLPKALIKKYEAEAVFRYNNLRHLSQLTDAQSLNGINQDWLRGLMQSYQIPVPNSVVNDWNIRGKIKGLNHYCVAPFVSAIAADILFEVYRDKRIITSYYGNGDIGSTVASSFAWLVSSRSSNPTSLLGVRQNWAALSILIAFGITWKAYVEVTSRLGNGVDNLISPSVYNFLSSIRNRPVEKLS
ncbi:MAG: hypothetical protein H0T84_02310 [Tatlockia sp.]|nr:hypothetical protein [Tatlockia sp.]